MATSKDIWRGYTLDELRFRRVLSMTKLELQKESVAQQFSNMRKGCTADGAAGMLSRMLGAFNYFEYAIFAFTVGRKLMRLFRRSK